MMSKHAGTIKKITLRSFMCFGLITVDFDEKINQIISERSSGFIIQKAIHAALGVQPHSTLKKLIKRGSQKCVIEIRLRNTGARAYQPHKYGTEIILQRIITHQTNSLHLRNCSGDFELLSVDDGQSLISRLHIEFWNPILMLNQHRVCAFTSAHAKQMYELFAKAFMINQLTELATIQSLNPEELIEQVMRTKLKQEEKRRLEMDVVGLRKKRAEMKRKHNDLVAEEAMVTDHMTWAKKENYLTVAEMFEQTLRSLNAEAANLEKRMEENRSQELELSRRVNEILSETTKYYEQWVKQNSLRKKLGFSGITLESQDSVRGQWNYPDAKCIIDTKSFQVQTEFLSVIKAQNAKARLIIDHSKREIRIMAQPMDIGPTRCALDGVLVDEKNIRQLTPEQRMYFGFALIMTLWRVSDSPFFSIDKFHQLLSPTNEEFIIGLMLQTAREKPKCQFIYFTPDVVPLIEPSQELSLLRLRSPNKDGKNLKRRTNNFANGLSVPARKRALRSINSFLQV